MPIKFIKLSFVVIVAISGAAGLFIWLGIFNVAATEKHWNVTTSLLEIIRDRSISTRSKNLTVPDLTSTERLARAAPNYDAMCAQCHLAPGIEKSELYEGLYPQPPVFHKRKQSSTRKPHEAFWVIKNGLKLTGMPAWGIYNSDEQIWDIVALLSTINSMTPEQYQKLTAAGKHGHAKGAGHDKTESPGTGDSDKNQHASGAEKDHHK